MQYKITKNSDNSVIAEKVSASDAMKYMQDNFAEIGTFTISEISSKKKSAPESNLPSYREFCKNLDEVDANDVRLGRKKVCKGVEGNWYLKVVGEAENHVSLVSDTRDSQLRNAMKECVMIYENGIIMAFEEYFPHLKATKEELDSMFNRLTVIVR